MEQVLSVLLCVILGAVFLAAAVFTWLRTRRFVEEAVPAYGEVIALREHHDDGVTYSPVVRFTGPDGRLIEFTESTSSNPAGYGVGDRVKILYRRSDASDARVGSTPRLYLLTIIFGAIGGSLFLVGILIAVFAVVG